MNINLYVGEVVPGAAIRALAAHIRRAYANRVQCLSVLERDEVAISA